MFGPVGGTPYDIRFSLFGIPVTVSPWFWLVAALLGFRWLEVEPGGGANVITWVLCVFVSILIHELGHALTMRAFGQWPRIQLYQFGGLAIPDRREPPGRSFLISAAGPAVQLVLYVLMVAACLAAYRDLLNWQRITPADLLLNSEGLVLGVLEHSGDVEFGTPVYAAIASMLQINLYWALINLLPVWPLDGGQMLEAALDARRVRSSREITLKVGIACGGVAAAYFLLMGGEMYAGFLFLILAIGCYRALQENRYSPW